MAAACLLLFVSGCGLMNSRSDLFRSLLEASADHVSGSYELFQTSQAAIAARSVDSHIAELLADGFELDIGQNVPDVQYATCGHYTVPTGDSPLILNRYTGLFRPTAYRMLISVDRNCAVVDVVGLKFEPTRL